MKVHFTRLSPLLGAGFFVLVFSQCVPAQSSAPLRRLNLGQQKGAVAPQAPVAPAESKPAPETTKPPDADAAGKSDDAKKSEEARIKAERLQKIQQLQFDRRPSAVLRAWASPVDNEAKQTTAESATPPDPTKSAPAPKDAFDAELKDFRRNVTLSNWPEVKRYLAELPEDEGKALYRRLLQALQGPPLQVPPDTPPELAAQMAQRSQQGPNAPNMEKNLFSVDDVLGLVSVAPRGIDKEHLPTLAAILRLSLDSGNILESFLARLRQEFKKPEAEVVLQPRNAAKLLVAAGFAIEAGEFLPPLEKAKADNDHEALNLLSRHLLALHAKEKKTIHLEQAWHVTQAVLASSEIKKEEKEEALKRAVELAPKIRDELGQSWLEESFTSRPQRGMEIIAAIGSGASLNLQTQPANPELRLNGLQLQTTAVEALLKAAPDKAEAWREVVNLLGLNWLREAVFAYQFDRSTSLGPQLRRDAFGNYFYVDEDGQMTQMPQQPSQLRGIKSAELLEIKPSDRWLSLVNDSLRPKFDMVSAQLYLKVNEENRAFPYIERLAKTHPDRARELVEEFLRVWTRNHDPNSNRNRTNYYMFMYGFERRAESIPLTRSKQERNLSELAKLVARLKGLDLGDLNEELLARAFTTCHSSAEVYRLEAIEQVFGPIEGLKPKTLAELAQQMRANLVGVWRQPAVQKDNKTNRKPKDIQAEVLRGYTVARSMVENALAKHPGEWSLQLAKASIDHDENNYNKELAADSKFSQKRAASFADFLKAAEMYAAAATDLPQEEETTRVYELWFYASLGACDLQQVSEDKQPDLTQPERIRDAILALPGESAERHMAMFANSLFTRMSAVNPAVKYRYLRTGLDIVGDHKQAAEARKVFDYYKDLVTEIKLDAVIDGPDVVGHKEPFGVFVNLRHTREIERESGGFGRYLQNQNANQYFSYNYGRPTENYRDKFQDIVKQSLGEQFDILSVTFQDDKVGSRAIPGEYGWRVTPYAYLLLKSRGPEVDKLPPLRLDLDFLDTSGYAIIPIESPAVPLDATPEKGQPRPVQKLDITQTLDERRAAEGKLVLEVKATARGLVPDLEKVLEIKPREFDVTDIDDQGVSVSRFDPDSDENLVVSERTWMVTLQAKPDLPARPKTFRFGKALVDGTELTYQRYEDADLAKVEEEIGLGEHYGKPSYRRAWAIGLAAIAVGALLLLLILWPRRTVESAVVRFQIPQRITPFTVLGLLKNIQQNDGLDDAGKRELAAQIDRIEHYYFVGDSDPEPNLQSIADSWIRRVM